MMRRCTYTVLLAWVWVAVAGVAVAGAPDPVVWLRMADALAEEAALIDARNLRTATLERAAAGYRDYAAAATGAEAARALIKAGNIYHDLGDVHSLALALVCAVTAVQRPDGEAVASDALLLKARVYRQHREWGRSVREALTCADRFPGHANAALALFEAAQVLEANIRNPGEARGQYTRIIDTYPASPVADQALAARAGLLAKDDLYEDAIRDHLAIVDRYPNSEIADQALFEAITIYDRNLKDFPKAYELAVRFRQTFPHSALLGKVERIEARTLRYVRDANP